MLGHVPAALADGVWMITSCRVVFKYFTVYDLQQMLQKNSTVWVGGIMPPFSVCVAVMQISVLAIMTTDHEMRVYVCTAPRPEHQWQPVQHQPRWHLRASSAHCQQQPSGSVSDRQYVLALAQCM